jgi:two-component system, response regulator
MPEAREQPPILVADDSVDDLFFARRALAIAAKDVPVITYPDGADLVAGLKAMSKQAKPPPRAVFLDIKMPRLDGFETLKWIREQEHLAELCVVMLSGSAEARDIARAKSLGADDYLVKNPSPADFARVLAKCGKQAAKAL